MSKNKEKYEAVISSIISSLENSGKLWEKPWSAIPPHNGNSGRLYRGSNILSLYISSSEQGFTSNSWFTFNQAKKLGGNVRKGEKGSRIGFFEIREYESDGDENKKIPIFKVYSMFNEEQIDFPEDIESKIKRPSGLIEKIPNLTPEEKLIEAWEFFNSMGINYQEIGERACYSPMKDELRMPKREKFKSDDFFFATLFHEIIHWTGNEKRLDRFDKNSFKKNEYAFEELVAEFGSAILCGFMGIEGEMQHKEYINSWLNYCRNEPNVIIKAASKAQAAVDYCLERAAKRGYVLFDN